MRADMDANLIEAERFQRPLKKILVPMGWGFLLSNIGILVMIREDEGSFGGLMLFLAAGCAWFWAMLAGLLPYVQVADGSVVVRKRVLGSGEHVGFGELVRLDEVQEARLFSLVRKNGGPIEVDLEEVREGVRAELLRVLERIVRSQSESAL